MPLEKQVCSLKWSQKLRELGVPQKSLFCWYESGDGKIFVATRAVTTGLCSAFTVAELGEMLPYKVAFGPALYVLVVRGLTNCIAYEGAANTLKVTKANTEADARAAMLVYLLENKLI